MELVACKGCGVVHAYRRRYGAPFICSNCGPRAEPEGVGSAWYNELDIEDLAGAGDD